MQISVEQVLLASTTVFTGLSWVWLLRANGKLKAIKDASKLRSLEQQVGKVPMPVQSSVVAPQMVAQVPIQRQMVTPVIVTDDIPMEIGVTRQGMSPSSTIVRNKARKQLAIARKKKEIQAQKKALDAQLNDIEAEESEFEDI